jgi:hypothetical protein
MRGDGETTALRGWLVAIALFEVPQIVSIERGAPLAGFFSTLKNARRTGRV